MNKSLEALDILYDGYQYGMAGRGYYDLIKQDLELLEQLKQQRDSLAINNGELVVKVCNLEKENQELLVNKNFAQGVALKYKKALEILKPILDIYAGEGKGYIDCCVENPIITFDLHNDKEFKEYELLKEVLEYD